MSWLPELGQLSCTAGRRALESAPPAPQPWYALPSRSQHWRSGKTVFVAPLARSFPHEQCSGGAKSATTRIENPKEISGVHPTGPMWVASSGSRSLHSIRPLPEHPLRHPSCQTPGIHARWIACWRADMDSSRCTRPTPPAHSGVIAQRATMPTRLNMDLQHLGACEPAGSAPQCRQ
jgi:hypothetical protein